MPIDISKLLFSDWTYQDWMTDRHEWHPRLEDIPHEQILDSLPFDVIERYVRKKKLEKIKKDEI
jgi:hypothetical protein